MPLTYYSKFSMFTLRIWVFEPGILKNALKKKKHLSPSTRKRNAQRMEVEGQKGSSWWQYNLCSNTDIRHQPLYRWNNANRPAQQRLPSHQHSNSIDKKRERSTQTRCTYTGSLPKPTKFDPDDPALIDRFPEYTPDIYIGDRPPTHVISSGRRPSKKKKYLSAIPEQGRRT